MYEAVAVERLDKPVAVILADGFEEDAVSAGSSRGMPGIRLVSENIPGECIVMDKVRAGLDENVMDNIVVALTKPLTQQEKSPKREVGELPRIVFKGDLQEVNHFLYMKGWTDGLPIIPPTEETVQEMLKGTDLPADHMVAELIPRLGKATVERIAINAVMAGALPTYMPLLIAGVQLLSDPDTRFGRVGVSTGSWAPFWIVNGPVRNDVGVYGSVGALSPGHMANATIGRAMGLIIKDIGGVRQGIEDMGVQGNPCKYSMVTGENEEESPWEPLHVEQGFNKDDSTITLFFPNSYVDVLTYEANAKGVLNTVIYNIPPARGGQTCILVNPTCASYLADEGWRKKDVERFVKEYARAPRNKHWWHGLGIRKEQLPFNDTDSMPLIIGDNQVRIVVSGKFSSYVGLAMGIFWPGFKFITKKVDLPANWGQLVEKYKHIAPTYARY
ncbi:hypothetical protein ACFLT4_04255 [Chloroflexota bacterium]